MAFIQGSERNQTMLLPAAIDDYICEENPVRSIDAFVDSIDLCETGFKVKSGQAIGRASYHPATLLKLYLWGYFSRVRSSRRLEQACKTNLEAIWLTGQLAPDHSTISDFRKKNPKALKSVFKQFNMVCLELNLFGRELVAIDGSFIKAVNSKSRSFTRGKLEKLIKQIDEAVAKYLEQLDIADENAPSLETSKSKELLSEKLKRIREKKSNYESLLEECQESPTGQISLTDPDSIQLRKRSQHTVGYNLQVAVDEKHHLVTSCEVTQESTDQKLLAKMANQSKSDLDLPDDAPLTVIADKGYGTGSEFQKCEQSNVQAIVPMQSKKVAGDGSFDVDDFEYQEDDTYRCPAGKVLPRRSDDVRDNVRYKVYYDSKLCKGCPMLEKCTAGKYRKIKISQYKDATDQVAQRLRNNPDSYKKRKSLVEHPFGTIKIWNGKEDLLCKGIELAQAESRLSLWSYNFKRVLKIIGHKGLMQHFAAC